MSRIDVVSEGADGFKILVNFIQRGVTLHNMEFANQEAAKVKEQHYPQAELNLAKIAKIAKIAKATKVKA